ncbi:apoptosis-inducing factor 3 [Asbolus verrucosus]|uniref:Apoptosis-inducing factor 3 n=1 Tax=Asbolus verrucosus TaxID=1661398 RepID=A0A482VJF9_ASBVE|nr:apoptosis-inducing factor 3 [Asbolus verrucosus]
MGCSTSKVKVSRSTGPDSDDEYVEGVVCKDSDVGENEMKTFDLGEAGRVLLVRQNGKLSALGAKCTHYGAPLVHGALGEGRVRCQWHGACFNLLNGDIEDFPGLDSLPCYQVTVSDDEVTVRARRAELESGKRVKAMAGRDVREAQHIVVVGGGPSGATCVETLRQEGFSGQITLVCKENCLPYDRVLVSKAMDFDINKAQFRTEQFYKDNGIEVLKGVEATAVNTTQKSVNLSNGATLNYDRLYVATGQKANKIPIEGADLQNVVVLRDYEHSRATQALLSEDIEVVVLGSSFVAMEAADYCSNKVKKVTVVARGTVPFKPLVGEAVGGAFKKLFEEKGVEFVTNSGMKRCVDDGSGKVSKVELIDGTIINADLVIMGVGSSCYTEFLKGSGLELRPDGSIEVDEFLQTNISGVYAGGDIAYAPVWSSNNRKSTIGHYSLAHYHGRIAAFNMLGKQKKIETVPYFWTKLFGKSLRYSGHGKFDDVVYVGDVDQLKFVAFYLNGDEVVAAASTGMDPVVSQYAELLAQGQKLYRKDVEADDKFQWTKKLHT